MQHPIHGLLFSPQLLCQASIVVLCVPASSVALKVVARSCKCLGTIVVGNVSRLQEQPIHVAPVKPNVVLLKEFVRQLALQNRNNNISKANNVTFLIYSE